MKAILVIDEMPSSCMMCEIRWSCKVWNKWKGYSDRLDGCPLKPLPEKKVSFYDIDIHEYDKSVDGWNACIDAILEPNSANGETE